MLLWLSSLQELSLFLHFHFRLLLLNALDSSKLCLYIDGQVEDPLAQAHTLLHRHIYV